MPTGSLRVVPEVGGLSNLHLRTATRNKADTLVEYAPWTDYLAQH